MKLGQGPSEADFGQDPGRFVRQDGPESQDLLIPRRGNAGIDPDNAAKLVFAHDEAGIVAAMAAVFSNSRLNVTSGRRLAWPDAERARYSSIFRPK